MCIEHWWDEDVQAFRNELDALKRPVCDQDGAAVNTDAVVSEFLQRKKKKVADIKEVSLRHVVHSPGLRPIPWLACHHLFGVGKGPQCRSQLCIVRCPGQTFRGVRL